MNIILFGPPGAGKGTQAEYIIHHFGIAHLSTGNMFRAAIHNKTPLGIKVKNILDSGELVSDEVVVDLVKEETTKNVYNNGCVFDGFPRTVNQAQSFDRMLAKKNTPIDALISLVVTEEELIKRILSRGQGRPDDTEKGIKNRLSVYQNETEPVLNYYKKQGLVKVIDGTGSVESVFNRIKKAL
ncbi:MAG: adenylate kinase [Bacteroidota bacterium]|nr:adenylate kinase [Bacteroidota bacterium]